MKKCISILLSVLVAIFTTLPAVAQSYDKLWRKAEAAIRQDLPQSALGPVNAV